MVKPMGVVAMLILLASGPALANERLLVKQIDVWGVTTTGGLYLETKRGDKYFAPIKHCPVVRSNRQYQFTPVELVTSFNNSSVSIRGKRVAENKYVTFNDRNGNESISCLLGNPVKVTS